MAETRPNGFKRRTPRELSLYVPVQSPLDIPATGEITYADFPRESHIYRDHNDELESNMDRKNLDNLEMEPPRSARRRKPKSQPEPEEQKHTKFITLLLMVLPEDRWGRLCAVLAGIVWIGLMLSITGIVVTLLSIHNDQGTVTAVEISAGLDYVKENIEADLITDIQLVSLTSSCPDGYERIVLGRWPGTFNGCDCPNGLNLGMCRLDAEPGCANVTGIDPIDIPIWDNVQWCAAKIGLGDSATINSPCDDGYNECWVGYCVKDGIECPVTDVLLSDAPLNENSTLYGTAKYITLFREQGKSGLVDIDLSNNGLSCFSEDLNPSGAASYKLIRGYPILGCEKYGVDSLFSTKIQQFKQEQVFRMNSFPQEVYDLPDYLNIIQETETYLVERRKISIGPNPECYQIDFTRADETSQNLQNFSNGVSACSLVALLAHLVVVIVIVGQGRNSDFRSSAFAFFTGFIIEIIIFVILVVLSRNSYFSIKENKDYFTHILTLNCFTVGQPNQVIKDLITFMTGNGELMVDLAMTLLIMSVSAYAFLIVAACFITRKQQLF